MRFISCFFILLGYGAGSWAVFAGDTSYLTAAGLDVPLFHHVNPQNISRIFTYQFNTLDADEFGAKAVAISVAGQLPTVFFFPVGSASDYFNIHHEQVLLLARDLQLHAAKIRQFSGPEHFPSIYQWGQGYQLQAKIIDGHWQITGFDIDSLITLHQKQEKLLLDRSLQERLLQETLHRIDPSLVRFSRPQWPGRLVWQCGAFLGPDPYR